MQIENYIKELLYDYSKVIIPGLGAFITSGKSAYINENEGKIYPPTKDILFNDNIKLDDGVLITKIREEESISKDKAIESIQAYIEQLLTKLNADRTYIIDDLGTFVKESDEYKLHFKQTDSINYLSDIFNLPVIDLPPKIALQKEKAENEVITNESFENPHESNNNEILPELTQEQEPEYPNDEELVENAPTTIEEEIAIVESETNPYQDNEVVNEYLSTNSAIEEEPSTSKSRIWWMLIPLLLLGGLAFGLYNLFLKNDKPATINETPALIEQQKPVETIKEEETKKIEKRAGEDEDLSSNSAAALLQSNKTKEQKQPEATETTKPNKIVTEKKSSEKKFYDGYYVVISSFEKESEAVEYSNNLRNKDYNTVILPNSDKHKRVSIYAGKDKAAASKLLPMYRKQLNKDAWILNFKNQ